MEQSLDSLSNILQYVDLCKKEKQVIWNICVCMCLHLRLLCVFVYLRLSLHFFLQAGRMQKMGLQVAPLVRHTNGPVTCSSEARRAEVLGYNKCNCPASDATG